MDPLVEVVRDTVGRHDTFGLACTAKYYEDMGYPGHVNCTRELQRAGDAVRDRAAHGLGGAQLLLQHGLRREQRLRHGRAVVAPRRLRAAAGDDRPRVRVVRRAPTTSTRRTAGRSRRSTCACTRPTTRFSVAIAHRVTPDADPVLTKETTFHPRTSELHEELRRVPRLLAPALLRQRGRDRRVLGVPREGRDHGPLAAAQVGGARPGRRGADPEGDHARRAPALGRPGHVHRASATRPAG